jgi:hypothetical protein
VRERERERESQGGGQPHVAPRRERERGGGGGGLHGSVGPDAVDHWRLYGDLVLQPGRVEVNLSGVQAHLTARLSCRLGRVAVCVCACVCACERERDMGAQRCVRVHVYVYVGVREGGYTGTVPPRPCSS